MLGLVAKYISDVSVLRRLLFALVHSPDDMPNRWVLALEFATNGKSASVNVTADQVRVLSENLHELDARAFATDSMLTTEILQYPASKPLGVVLISKNETCRQCKSILLLRKDRPSPLVIYHDAMGSIPGTHYHKYCSNKKCSYTQYFEYHTRLDISQSQHNVYFDTDWETLPYFVSSRETAFDMKLLRRFDSEILLGQQSFKQCADVYNHLHLVLLADGSSNTVVV